MSVLRSQSANVRSEARGSPVGVTCRCLRSEPNSCKLSLSTQIDESVVKIPEVGFFRRSGMWEELVDEGDFLGGTENT